MHVRMRLPTAPPPPHLLCRHPVLCIPLWRTRQCSWGCLSRSSFSIIPSSISAASSPPSASSKASISYKQPSASELHASPLCHSCVAHDISQEVTFWAKLPCFITLFPTAQLSLPLQQSLSPILFTTIHFLKHRSGKKQASCLFFLRKCPLAGQLVFHCPSGG